MKNENKIALGMIVLFAFAMLVVLVLAVPSVIAHEDAVYFVPEQSSIPGGPSNNITVEIWVNTTCGFDNWGTDILFDPACVNITNVTYPVDWLSTGFGIPASGRIRIGNYRLSCSTGNPELLATLTVHCEAWDCTSPLNLTAGLVPPYIKCLTIPCTVVWINGTIKNEALAPPAITSFAPSSPVNDTVCNWRTFNVTMNQTVNVSWYLNDSLRFINESVSEANCLLHADVPGEHNVSAIAANPNGTDMQTWIWNVTPAPTCNISLATGWNMITLPFQPANLSASSVLPTIPNAGGIAYVWNASKGAYDAVYDNIELELGRAYWISIASNGTWTPGGSEVHGIDVNLTSGWNMIGILSCTNVSVLDINITVGTDTYNLVDAVNNGYIGGIFYAWNAANGEYEATVISDTAVLNPGIGYFANVNQTCAITYP
ncbi:MAG: hypothetical protein WAV32_07555 [Halobacteriota archaeon]